MKVLAIDGKDFHYVDHHGLPVGAMWWDRNDAGEILTVEERKRRHLTAQYWAVTAKSRAPITVILPSRHLFCVDSQCWNEKKGHYDGWTVTGKAPNLTVHPSIHFTGHYHGHLVKGVVGGDVDGRKFDSHGILIKGNK